MKEEPQNSCKDHGMVHAWKNITSNVVCATYPPQYPPKEEQCANCGLVRTFYSRTEEWVEYSLREKPKRIDHTSITVSNDLVTGAGTTGTNLQNIPVTLTNNNDN